MRILPNENDEVPGVPARWKAQYFTNNKWGGCGDARVIYERLAALPVGATWKDVAAIVGNDSWTGQDCTECRKHGAVVLVGEEPDYESATVWLCAECARAVVRLIESALSSGAVDPDAGSSTDCPRAREDLMSEALRLGGLAPREE